MTQCNVFHDFNTDILSPLLNRHGLYDEHRRSRSKGLGRKDCTISYAAGVIEWAEKRPGYGTGHG